MTGQRGLYRYPSAKALERGGGPGFWGTGWHHKVRVRRREEVGVREGHVTIEAQDGVMGVMSHGMWWLWNLEYTCDWIVPQNPQKEHDLVTG